MMRMQMIIINMTLLMYLARTESMHRSICMSLGVWVPFVIKVRSHICMLLYLCVCVCQTVAHWYAECLQFPCGAGWDRKHLSPLQRSSMLPI